MTMIKRNLVHPNGFLNYLITTDIVSRETYFLSAILNRISLMVLRDELDQSFIDTVNSNMGDIMHVIFGHTNEGIRGYLREFIVDCNWSIDEFILIRKKEYGKS